MKVDLLASEAHYFRHALPVFEALPQELRGRARLMTEPIDLPVRGRVAMVASFQDVRALGGRCQIVYVEHGAGQSYAGGDGKHAWQPGYSASHGIRNRGVIGYISPNQTVADLWDKPSIAVGCPAMDAYMDLEDMGETDDPTAVIGFHWPCKIAPEADTTWPHYAEHLAAIAHRFERDGWKLYGHVHPKWNGRLDAAFAEAGIELIDVDRVYREADLLLYDNSSLMYEVASLGRQVWCLNSPVYRRDVEHGLRFWEHAPGVQIDSPEQLLDLSPSEMFLADPGEARRKAAVDRAYAFTDGQSAERAARWITELVESR